MDFKIILRVKTTPTHPSANLTIIKAVQVWSRRLWKLRAHRSSSLQWEERIWICRSSTPTICPSQQRCHSKEVNGLHEVPLENRRIGPTLFLDHAPAVKTGKSAVDRTILGRQPAQAWRTTARTREARVCCRAQSQPQPARFFLRPSHPWPTWSKACIRPCHPNKPQPTAKAATSTWMLYPRSKLLTKCPNLSKIVRSISGGTL